MMDVVLYYTEDGKVQLDVHLERETVWLSQRQMAELLDKDTDTIGLHIRNIYNEGELSRKGTTEESSVVQTEGGRQVRRNVNLYNLDVIISVGYRVKSQRGVQFRQWATQTLKQHLIQGYTLNRKRLAQLGTDVDQLMGLMQQTLTQNKLVLPEGAAIADLIRDYARTWQLLLAYDERKLEEPDGQKRELVLDATIVRQAIHQLKTRLKQNGQATDLFGRERDQALDGILGNLHQTFDGQLLYPTAQARAAHLLYFVIKDHPFADGNKRIGSFLFLLYLQSHGLEHTPGGRPRFADNALVALALLVAESEPGQKALMIRLIQHLIGEGE
jgi:prophage maintenance system killer protein